MGAAGLESLENAYWLWIIKYMTGVFFFQSTGGKKKAKGAWIHLLRWLRVHQLPHNKTGIITEYSVLKIHQITENPSLYKKQVKVVFYSACRQEIREGKWVKGFLLIGINFGLGTASCRAIETQLRQNCQHKRMWYKTPAILWLGEERGSGGPVFSVGVLITACRTDAINLRLTG